MATVSRAERGQQNALATWLEQPLRRASIGASVLSAVVAAASIVGAALLGNAATTAILISVVAVVGLQVFFGNSGILSFGHAGFVALGAYASGLLTMPSSLKAMSLPALPQWLMDTELPLIAAAPIAAVGVGVVATLVGIVIVRLSGYSAAIASLGVLVITHSVLLGLPDYTRGAQTFYGLPPSTTLAFALGAAVVAIFVARLFRESTAGLQLRASREDELAARSFGSDVRMRRLQAWVIAAMLAALAGALLAHYITAFSPKQFYFPLTFSYIVMLIIGGTATVFGAVIGTTIVMLISEVLRGVESGVSIGPLAIGPIFGLTQIILALLMLLVMYFRRDGIVGLREPDEAVLDRISSRTSARHRA